MTDTIGTAQEMADYIASGDVSHDAEGNVEHDYVTCGTCGRTWDDARITGVTPAPSGRCPFEYWHEDEAPGGEDSAPTFHVEIDGEYGAPEGAVRVIDNEGAEYVMWDSAEWIEDPSLVYVILNYVRTALSDPAALPNLNPNLGRWQSYSIVPDDGLECVICGERIDGDAWVRETELFTGPEARCAKHGAPGGGPQGGEDA